MFAAIGVERDSRKGFDLLRDALFKLRKLEPTANMIAVVCGSGTLKGEYPVPVRTLGMLRDEISLCLAYNSADIFVSASREDNLPNTVLEAMSCGIPCVGFDVGGVSDLVVHRETGYLARPEDSASLAEGIAWVLAVEARRKMLGDACREKALRENAAGVVANRHIALYEQLLASPQMGRAPH